jgi:hypothetical protein
MQSSTSSVQPRPARRSVQSRAAATPQIAIDEYELAARWGLSVRTLRRWRTERLGPVFCKLGARISYLIAEIEAFERRHCRYGTGARVSSDNASAGGAA